MNLKQIEEDFDEKFVGIDDKLINGIKENPSSPKEIKQFYRQKIEEMLDEINPYNRKYNNGCKCDQCNMIRKIEELRI